MGRNCKASYLGAACAVGLLASAGAAHAGLTRVWDFSYTGAASALDGGISVPGKYYYGDTTNDGTLDPSCSNLVHGCSGVGATNGMPSVQITPSGSPLIYNGNYTNPLTQTGPGGLAVVSPGQWDTSGTTGNTPNSLAASAYTFPVVGATGTPITAANLASSNLTPSFLGQAFLGIGVCPTSTTHNYSSTGQCGQVGSNNIDEVIKLTPNISGFALQPISAQISNFDANDSFALFGQLIGSSTIVPILPAGTLKQLLADGAATLVTAAYGSNPAEDVYDINFQDVNGDYPSLPTFVDEGGYSALYVVTDDQGCTGGSTADTCQDAFTLDNLYAGWTPIPEPASLALFGTGLVGLGAMLRRRRQTKAS